MERSVHGVLSQRESGNDAFPVLVFPEEVLYLLMTPALLSEDHHRSPLSLMLNKVYPAVSLHALLNYSISDHSPSADVISLLLFNLLLSVGT